MLFSFSIIASLCVWSIVLVEGARPGHHLSIKRQQDQGVKDETRELARRHILSVVAPDDTNSMDPRPTSCDEVHCSGPSTCKLTEEGFAECFIDPTLRPEDDIDTNDGDMPLPTSCKNVECYGPSRCEITKEGFAECLIDPTIEPEDPNTVETCDENVKCAPQEECKVYDGVPTCVVPLPQTIEVKCPTYAPETGDKCQTELGLCQYNPFWCYGHTELTYTIECKCSTGGVFMCSSRTVYCPPPIPTCMDCTNESTPWMKKNNKHCESSHDILRQKCNKDEKWIAKKYCQRSCDNVGQPYDDQDKCCKPSCIECSNEKTSWMVKYEKECDSSAYTLNHRCNKDGQWKKHKFCRLSCYNNGTPYDDDVCCDGNDNASVSASSG
mmetsp:Transcript_5373/g.7749  ORF Transcript_5373/g.7749 Transcript_5373/m.7749 type:complete len:382 (-) Transcript_5373:120-1265(-)